MNAVSSLRRTFFLALLVFVVVISFTAWFTVNKVFLQQSRLQQEAVSPIFALIVEELLQPLHIAETTYKSGEFVDLLDSEPLNEEKLIARLGEYEEAFDLTFFAASEKARIQYFSNGRQIDLIEGKVIWYFNALANPRDFIADLGDINDVHLFFDFKVYDEDKKLLGIVGVGKSMKRFLQEFQRFKQRHGYDFIFINEKQQLLLSSNPDILSTEVHLTQLQSMPWYDERTMSNGQSLNNTLVENDGQSFLLSEVKLQSLNWRVILMLPLQNKQNQLNNIFINNFATIMLAALFFVGFVFVMSRYLGQKFAKHVDIDHLSQLPNRRYVERRFNRFLEQEMNLGVVVVDVDHFKSINDNFGHNVGDIVIQRISAILDDAVRSDDIAARWGGEEFILILPGASFKIAIEIAERIRRILSKTDLHIDDHTLHITASFGVTYSEGKADLLDLVEVADNLLYQAKAGGRNCVRAGLM